jgi:anaerobic selenocysteine-containing dehydrogenase
MAPDSATQLVRGACPHDCPDTCATITEVRDGRAVAFYADTQHAFTDGWLCAKVRPYLERVNSPDRLLYPMRRAGPKGSGQWERISWEQAVTEIAGRWQRIIAEHGAAAILPYSYSGTLGMLQNVVSASRLWNRMGVSGLERSICGAAAETAVEATLGGRWGPEPADVLHSRLVLIWGHNPASTGPHFMPLLRQAQKRGAYVVVIDPRRTVTARSADEHIRPRPATDGALALGLLHVIFAEGLHDEPWLEAHSLGWRELRERAAAFPRSPASRPRRSSPSPGATRRPSRRCSKAPTAYSATVTAARPSGRSAACRPSSASTGSVAAASPTAPAATRSGTPRRSGMPRPARPLPARST